MSGFEDISLADVQWDVIGAQETYIASVSRDEAYELVASGLWRWRDERTIEAVSA